MGIEPTWPAWKAGALPLSYTRECAQRGAAPQADLVGRRGFEPLKAEPTDLQSVPFGHFGISPGKLTLRSFPGSGVLDVKRALPQPLGLAARTRSGTDRELAEGFEPSTVRLQGGSSTN